MELAVETRPDPGFRQFSGGRTAGLAVPAEASTDFGEWRGQVHHHQRLTGLLKPSAGSMRILGIDPRAIGSVGAASASSREDLALFDRLTASETLRFVADVHGIDRATTNARSADLLKLMALESAGNTLVTDYSHGMRKKLSLAAALLPAPRLLFLDEPFEGIDAVASRQIKDLLLSFVARGGTIFLTSHILEIVERLSTHLGVIAQGKLVAQAPVAELRGSGGQTLEELFIGLVGGEAQTRAELDWF